MNICRHYFISGRVQGVYYRSSTRRTAAALGVSGWVRNLGDGRVEALACGEAAQLDRLEMWLRIGPQWANVTNIEVSEQEPSVIPASFDVK